MSSFLSDNIKEIFCKYDDNYISPSVKRFLRECIIQLTDVSLSSITNHSNKKIIAKNKLNPNNNFTKQLSLLTEWLENFIEPSHISMYTQTIIHIICQLEKNVTISPTSHRHHHRHSLSSRTPRQSMSFTTTPIYDFTMTPVEEQQHKKFQRLSLFNRNSGNTSSNHDDDIKYNNNVQRSSFTINSQTSEIRLAINASHQTQNSHSHDDINNGYMDLHWDIYEHMSIILVRSLTSILNKLLKRYNYKVSVIFDDQFDKIIDDVIQFLFSRLTLQYGDKFRGIIGDCLGVISRKYLQKICERIHLRWAAFGDSKKNVKGNDLKKFAILHRAVKYLEFDIYGRNRDAAIDYLTHLCIRMQRTEKKILRQQICHSLLHIFHSISPQKKTDDTIIQNDAIADHDRTDTIKEMNNKPFIRLCPKDSDEEFWALYYNIFNIVEGWSHKKGCTIFCYELIIKMMCCGNLPFYLHVLKYEPKSKSGYILPSLHRNVSGYRNSNIRNKNMINNSLEIDKSISKSNISALPDNPSKSPIIKFLISNLTNDNTKRDTLRIILQFIQELPEEFVLADNEWYAKLLNYLENKIILSSNPNQSQELKIIAAIFTAFAERDGKSYFVPAIQRLLVDNKLWWNRIGLETLHHAVVVFGHSLSRYNFTLGACLSPFVRGTQGPDFQLLALQCWPTIRSPRERVEDIHNEVMCMVQLINGKATNQQFARLAADNLINYVEIDFENHLIPVVSSLLSPMRDFKRFNVNHLKITIEVLSKIVTKLITYLELYYQDIGYTQQYYANAQYLSNSRMHNLSDSEYDEFNIEEDLGSMDNIIDAVANANTNTNTKNLPIPMRNLNSIHDHSVEYDDINQEYYRVRNALSLIEMWPHIRLLIEGYILLWYLHPDQYIRDQLAELLSIVRHPIVISNIDPHDGPPSIYDQLQRYNSRHHKNDGYSSSGNVNLGTNTSTISNNSNKSDKMDKYIAIYQKEKRMAMPLRYNHSHEQYKITHQFPPELDRLIFKKRKSFEGLLNWIFLRTADQLAIFFEKIMKEEVPMELYDDDEFVLMKHRWELMCLSVRIDESYYQQTNDDKYIASFHRARSSSLDNKYKYSYPHSPNHNHQYKYDIHHSGSPIHNHNSNTMIINKLSNKGPHMRYATQSSTNSNQYNHKRGREVSSSQTVVINGVSKQLKNRRDGRDISSQMEHIRGGTNDSRTIHHKQNTNSSIDPSNHSMVIVNRITEKKQARDIDTIEPIKVVGNEAVQDLLDSIKFSRAMSQTPTASQLKVGKNRLRLIGRPSSRKEKETNNELNQQTPPPVRVKRKKKRSKSSKKDQKKYTVRDENNVKKRVSLIKTGINLVQSLNGNKSNKSPDSKSKSKERENDGNNGTPSTRTRNRLPSHSKESINPPPDLDIGMDIKDIKTSNLLRLDPSPNGSPLPAPLIQGDSREEMDSELSLDVTDMDDDILNRGKQHQISPLEHDHDHDTIDEDDDMDDDYHIIAKLNDISGDNNKHKHTDNNNEDESKWNGSNDEEEKGDVVGPLLGMDNMRPLDTPKVSGDSTGNNNNNKKHQQVHYSEDVQYSNNMNMNTVFGYPGGAGIDGHSDSDEIYDYHREQISMFLVPMTDIRIPKRKLHTFLDEIISFTLNIKNTQIDSYDEILDSIFEPIQRMDVIVSALLVERLFLQAFWSEGLPQSENDNNYQKWKLDKLCNFYFHAPTLHLLSIIFTNRNIISYDYCMDTFHHPSNEFAIGLDKIIIASVYLVNTKQLNEFRSFETILYLLILMKQFFYFYRNEEPKFKYHPFLDIPGMKNMDNINNNNYRILLMKKPRPLSNMRMRANLLDFIQTHMSIIPKKIRKELRKLEDSHVVNELINNRDEIHNKKDLLTDEIRNKKQYQKLIYLHNSIEIALAECILGLIELGPIGEKQLEMALLKELEKYICHQSNNKLKTIAQLGMNAVFKHNSHLLEHFIQQSCKLHLYYNEFVVGSQNTIQVNNNHDRNNRNNKNNNNKNRNHKHNRNNRNDKNITLISLAYLTSLVSNFQSNIIGLNPISALVLCMLHQCSPHQQARNLALKLAKCMAINDNNNNNNNNSNNNNKRNKKNKFKYNFNPGDNFSFSTTESSPDKYLKFAFDYSARISKLRPEIVPQILYEVVRFYDRVESEYDREILLRLLPPWIAQFSTVTNKISDFQSCREMSYAFIVKLYELTHKASCSENNNYERSQKQLILSYKLWCNLALSKPDKLHFGGENGNGLDVKRSIKYNEMLISEIVKYIINRYTLYYVEEHSICENILIKICNECIKNKNEGGHTTNLYLLGQCLGKSLHRYPDEFPLEPDKFNQYKLQQLGKKKYQKDVIKSTEQSAFKLINKLLDNKIINPFKKYIPLLLQNAAVTNNYKNTFDDIVLRLAKYFQIESHPIHNKNKNKNTINGSQVLLIDQYDEKQKDKLNIDEKEKKFEGIMIWKKYNPEMCKLWSDLAISWALQANKPHITMYSVEVFDALDSYILNYDLLVQLSLITYHCIKQTNYPTGLFTMILQILQTGLSRKNISNGKKVKWENDQYKIALSLAYILLSLQHESIHQSSLSFWNKFLNITSSTLSRNIINDMHTILSFNNNKNIDQIIAQQLQHSLARETLFESSVTMLEKLCCLLSSEIPAKSNKLLHLTVLSHMLKIQLNTDGIRTVNCDRLIYVLSHYKKECKQMIKQCKNIQLYANFNDFLTECCKTYFEIFPSISVFRGGLTALCKFIEYGSKLWYISVLNIINIILDVTENNKLLLIDSQQFKQISNILILSSYLSPIKVFNTNKQITNQKSIHMSKKKKNKSIIQLAEEEQLNEYEYINLTPLVSRIALKLTKRKQLKLPKDKSFLFQFIDPLPQSLKRICKEEEIKKNQNPNNTSSSSYNKRLVLTIEQEKKCEKDTILRLNDYLLPLLTRVVKTSQASKHMRSGSILNFNKANIFDLKTISNQLNNETNAISNQINMKVKIPKDKNNKEPNHNAFNSARSVVVLDTPSVNYSDVDDIVTPQPNDISLYNNNNNNQINSNDILYDVDEEEEDDDDDDSNDTQSNDSINQSYANYTQKHNNNNNNYNDEEKHIIYNDTGSDDDDDNESEQEQLGDLTITDPGDMDLLDKSQSARSVRIHKQFSTKDYGTYGYGNDGKKNIETNKKDTLLIKVEQIPPKVNDKQLEKINNNKHIKNKKSNSNNSVIENW